MKLDKFDLRLDRDGAMYLAGEEVSGTLYVNTSRAVTLSKIGVKLTGIVHTGWVNKTSDVVYESNDEIVHDYMDATNYLADVSDGELLPEGEHFIKFHFKLSMDIVASMHNDYFGWVRYTCSGLLAISDNTCFRLGGNNEIVVDKSITVYSVLNLDAPHFRLPSTASDSVELVGCCRRHGSLSAKMTIAEQGMLPGETAKITLVIENGSRKQKKARCPVVALCQQLDFKSQNCYIMDLYDRKSQTLVIESIGTCQATPGAGPQVKLVDFIIPVGLPPTSTKANGLITISYFFKLDMDDFELVIPVGEEMVETAAVAASAYANECGVCFPGLSSKLDAQATASGSSSSVANNADADSSKEIDHFWIQCDVCITWFHGKCVDVEEYESAVIDQYHCPTCQLQHGSSVWKAERNHHRYVFDDLTQDDLPTQIGTRCFIDDFKQNQDRFPLASDKQLIRLDSGYDFVSHFNERQEWMKPYLITHAEGLGLRMPGDDFSVEDCVGLMGADRAVDTIDVYKQHTYQMSLGRYLKKWHDVDRPRLYNILSLEFSHSKLCEVVGPPSIVPKLSWVHQFWPAGKADATTPTTLATLLHAGDVHVEHLRAKPEVALFCLIGMRDSYTDFHIDFGGSSVWYHVFKGAKVFYVVEPTHANLALFGEYQKNPKRSEIFFGDLLPPGAVTRVVVEQGRTLLIPSGWIHAVWTPEDSLVFGGNFLHSLNIPMQLRIYEMELDCHTDERFMFPSFELTNWYAARSVLESLKEANEDGHLADAHLIKGARALLPFLRTWIKRDKTNKRLRTSVTFGNIVQQLQRELNGQEKLRKRPNGDADSPSRRRQRSSPKSPRQRKNLKSLKLKLVLDKNERQSTVEKPTVREAEEKSEAMDVEEKKAVTPIKLSLNTATSSALCSDLAKTEVSEGDENEEQPSPNISTTDVSDSNASPVKNSEPFSLLRLGTSVKTEGLCRPATTKITIRIGQAIEQSRQRKTLTSTDHPYNPDDDDDGDEGEEEERLNLTSMLGVSSHGRLRKPSQWVTDATRIDGDFVYPSLKGAEELTNGSYLSPKRARTSALSVSPLGGEEEKSKSTVSPAAGTPTAKKIPPQMAQLAEKAAEREERQMERLMKLNKKRRKSAKATLLSAPEEAPVPAGQAKIPPPTSGAPVKAACKTKKGMSTAKQRLANKLKLRKLLPNF